MFVKLLSVTAQTPIKKYSGDAGFDLFLPEDVAIKGRTFNKQVKLGIAVQLAHDEVALTIERSSIAIQYGVHCIGPVIDSNYRGEISLILSNPGNETCFFKRGERVAQLVVLKLGNPSSVTVDTLDESARGIANHGSSGK